MRIVRRGVLALAAVAATTLMTSAAPNKAAACTGNDCPNLCACLASCSPGDFTCQENCHWLFPNCDVNHICP